MIGSEEWKHGGECLKCRRHGYCKKQCKENKRLVNEHLTKVFWNKVREKMAAQQETENEETENREETI